MGVISGDGNRNAGGEGRNGWDGRGDTEDGRGRRAGEQVAGEEVGHGENITIGRECTRVWGGYE